MQPPRKRARKRRENGSESSENRAVAKRKGKGRRDETTGLLSELMNRPLDVFFQVRPTYQFIHYSLSNLLAIRLLHTSILSTCSISPAHLSRYAPLCLPKAPGRRGSLLLPLWTAFRRVRED